MLRQDTGANKRQTVLGAGPGDGRSDAAVLLMRTVHAVRVTLARVIFATHLPAKLGIFNRRQALGNLPQQGVHTRRGEGKRDERGGGVRGEAHSSSTMHGDDGTTDGNGGGMHATPHLTPQHLDDRLERLGTVLAQGLLGRRELERGVLDGVGQHGRLARCNRLRRRHSPVGLERLGDRRQDPAHLDQDLLLAQLLELRRA